MSPASLASDPGVRAWSGTVLRMIDHPAVPRFRPFIATLAIEAGGRSGISPAISRAQGQSINCDYPPSFIWLGRGGANLGLPPNAVVLDALLYLAGTPFMTRTDQRRKHPTRRRANPEAARLSGIRPPSGRCCCLCGLRPGAGLGGVITASQTQCRLFPTMGPGV